jgi:modulator of FtsH protease
LTAYDASEWSDLFVAAAGAGAALAGLVFVAVSINIKLILAGEGLPDRALQTVLTLLMAVCVSIVALIPGQDHIALGAELLIITVGFGVVVLRLSIRSLPPGSAPRHWIVGRLFVLAIGVVPLLVGSISVLAEGGGGLYWIAAGIVGALVGAVVNAWVLLVEILR